MSQLGTPVPGVVQRVPARRLLAGARPTGIEADFEKATDIQAVLAHGVMSTPALVIDDEGVASGRIPTRSEARRWLAG